MANQNEEQDVLWGEDEANRRRQARRDRRNHHKRKRTRRDRFADEFGVFQTPDDEGDEPDGPPR